MWNTIQFFLLVGGYLLVTFFIIKFFSRLTIDFHPIPGILIRSFLYALFWGVGIAGSSGHPGFALPAPNIVALGLMAYIGFYQGVLTGLIILGFWWAIIFIVMFIRQMIRKRKAIEQEIQE